MGEIELLRERERKTERFSERKRVNEKNKKEGFLYRKLDK